MRRRVAPAHFADLITVPAASSKERVPACQEISFPAHLHQLPKDALQSQQEGRFLSF